MPDAIAAVFGPMMLAAEAPPATMTNFELSIVFFLQLAVLLGVCRLVGIAARRVGQPQVVGEMIAGVLLGPSLLGGLAPGLFAALFPKQAMPVIYCVAQVGLALYMFTVGMEFNVRLIKQRSRSAASVSLAGIVTPFALGAGLAAWMYHDHALFAEGVKLHEAIIFLGAAMSITAFPMLARILYERRLTGTSLGTLALAAGSIDDAIAWCLLAAVLAMFKNDATIALVAIGGGVAYALVTLLVVRPLLAPLGGRAERAGAVSTPMFGAVLVMVMLAAWLTDKIGIYAVFGAFILGLAMPRGVFARDIDRKIEPLTTNLLLPMFFVYSGLNTQITLVNTPALWLIAGLVLAAACVGKAVACYVAARIHGEPHRDAAAIGSLMNARGLMELIILNIGLEHGLITPTLFSIMVIMAIATTLMATPMFQWVYGRQRDREERAAAARAAAV